MLNYKNTLEWIKLSKCPWTWYLGNDLNSSIITKIYTLPYFIIFLFFSYLSLLFVFAFIITIFLALHFSIFKNVWLKLSVYRCPSLLWNTMLCPKKDKDKTLFYTLTLFISWSEKMQGWLIPWTWKHAWSEKGLCCM